MPVKLAVEYLRPIPIQAGFAVDEHACRNRCFTNGWEFFARILSHGQILEIAPSPLRSPSSPFESGEEGEEKG